MNARHRLFLSLVVLLGSVFGAGTTYAQSLSPDVKFICGAADSTTKTAHCTFQVPADTIGSKLMIEIPKEKVAQVTGLKKGDNVSASSMFFHLDVGTATNGNISLRVDFADLKAQAFSNTPFILFQLDIGLISIDPAGFPMTINAVLKKDSELHTPASLVQNVPAFKAGTDIALPITIASVEGLATSAPSDVTSTFKFAGDDDAVEPELRPSAPVLTCFADPPESMTAEEWIIICDAKTRGIISGNPQPNGAFYFFPNQSTNRAEVIKIVMLGILRTLGFLSDSDFSAEQAIIDAASAPGKSIAYPDITYEADGLAPWFAVYISLATKQKIVGGYPDGTFRPANKITNPESYRVIGETGRVASPDIAQVLASAILKTKDLDWYLKYVEVLDHYDIMISKDYLKYTTRKEFVIIVMNLLKAVGL